MWVRACLGKYSHMEAVVLRARLQQKTLRSQVGDLQASDEVGDQVGCHKEPSALAPLYQVCLISQLTFANASASDHIPRTPPFC